MKYSVIPVLALIITGCRNQAKVQSNLEEVYPTAQHIEVIEATCEEFYLIVDDKGVISIVEIDKASGAPKESMVKHIQVIHGIRAKVLAPEE